MVGFLVTIASVAMLDAVFTYLSKQIIDDGIVPRNPAALREIIIQYAVLMVVQAVGVFGFIYLAGVLGERVQYDLRKKLFNHLQDAVVLLLQQDAGRLDHVARHVGLGAHRAAGHLGHAGRHLGVLQHRRRPCSSCSGSTGGWR